MRLSADKSDPGYVPWRIAVAEGKSIRVLLDGIEQREVVTADDELGVLVRPKLNWEGKLLIDPDNRDRVWLETLQGQVRIEISERA